MVLGNLKEGGQREEEKEGKGEGRSKRRSKGE